MLLSLSETLAQAGDWIAVHFAELGGVISIPVVVWFIAKLVLSLVSKRQAIKNATLKAVKKFNNDINVLKDEVKTRFDDLERNIENKIDGKFDELREKRKEIYNNIMAGVDKLEIKAQEVIEETKEKVEEIAHEVIKEIDNVAEVADNTKPEISVEDILR